MFAIFSQVIAPWQEQFPILLAQFIPVSQPVSGYLLLIDEKPLIVDASRCWCTIAGFSDSIEFKNVSFAYQEKEVLSGINLIVPKGKTVALVGPSGGGKSTLMDLLPRFIEPQSGEIRVDR